ncbi:MAG: hypothetical protein ACK5X3_05625 [Pseudomonadota bacterium]
MKPLTRYDAPYAPMQADPNGDWYAKDEADAVIRHYQDEALCAEEAAMTHAQRVHELEAERDAARADAERMRGHMRYFVDNDFNRVRKQRDQAHKALERIAASHQEDYVSASQWAWACVQEATAIVGEQEDSDAD